MKRPIEGIADPQDTAYSKNKYSQVIPRESQVQSFPVVIKSFLEVIKSFPEATKSFLRVGLKPSSSHGLKLVKKHRNWCFPKKHRNWETPIPVFL